MFITYKIVEKRIVDYQNFSKILPKIESNLIMQLFFYQTFIFFLCTGTTFALFHISGNTPFFNDTIKIIFRGMVIGSLQIFIILTDKLSYPCALGGSNDFSLGNMSFSVAWKELILLFVLQEKYDSVIAFFIGVHIDAKKLLRNSLFY